MSFPQGTLRRKIQQSSYALLNIGEEHSVSASRAKNYRRRLDAASSFDLELLGRIVPFLPLSGMEGNCSMLTATECRPWRCPLTPANGEIRT
jgi:hypothetical protein